MMYPDIKRFIKGKVGACYKKGYRIEWLHNGKKCHLVCIRGRECEEEDYEDCIVYYIISHEIRRLNHE